MPNAGSLPKSYAKGLSWHGCGHALWHPVPVENLRAPCVGYFDDQGKWHLIASLVGTETGAEGSINEYSILPDRPKRQSTATHEWGPKQSSDVYDTTVGLAAGTPDLSAAGIPVQFSIETKYRTATEFGAFLVTRPPVVHENYNDGYNNQYKRWVKQNFARLYENGGPELERFGLWVITETFSTTAAMIQTFSGKMKEVKLDLRVKAMMAGEFGPLYEKGRDRTGEAVNFFLHEEDGGRLVVFCDGIRYRFRKWNRLKYEPHLSSDVRKAVYRSNPFSPIRFSDILDLEPVRSRESRSPDLSNALQTANGTDFEMQESRILDSDTDGEDEDDDDEHDLARHLDRAGVSRGGLRNSFPADDHGSREDIPGVRSFNEDGERLKLAQEGPRRGLV